MEGTRVAATARMRDENFLAHLKARHPEMLAFDPDKLAERGLFQTAHDTHFHHASPPSDGHFHSEG